MKLSPQDFKAAFGKVTPYVDAKISGYGFEHRPVTTKESHDAILKMVEACYKDPLPVSGPSRHPVWEKGWAENAALFCHSKAGLEAAKPAYMNKHQVVRWGGELYVPCSPDYEYNMLAVVGDYAFDKWLRDFNWIGEFGCGTGHNMFRMREVCPEARLVGLDWAKSACQFINMQAVAGAYGDPGLVTAQRFDYFNPGQFCVNVPSKSAAFVTVASLEQVGAGWRPFFDFVMEKKPELCLHIEPFEEVLLKDNLLDLLCLDYMKKRGYLSGFLTALLGELAHKVELLDIQRTGIGSLFIEGYTVVAWRPRT